MDFDINTYLDSLPEDTECIYLNKRNLTFIPSLERFKNLRVLNCSNNKLRFLPSLNENLRVLNCSNNLLSSLPSLNEKLERLDCEYNELSSLPCLNENLRELNCEYNQLRFLPSLNENLRVLICNNNQLRSLPSLNEKLEILYFYNNQLHYLKSLNKKFKRLYCYNNPICEIIDIEKGTMDICKKQIQILNNFRYLYWCLYFKKQLKKLLWERIREPKIMKQYHPNYLFENLRKDTADLNKFLDTCYKNVR